MDFQDTVDQINFIHAQDIMLEKSELAAIDHLYDRNYQPDVIAQELSLPYFFVLKTLNLE